MNIKEAEKMARKLSHGFPLYCICENERIYIFTYGDEDEDSNFPVIVDKKKNKIITEDYFDLPSEMIEGLKYVE